jgi:uncharacterized protein YndB with AHSA1/START domain
MAEDLSVSDVLPAPIDVVFDAFLDSAVHSAMTGGAAKVSDRVGDDFTAWGGYITGTNLELERPTRIVQRWRADDFPEGADPSRLEILLSEKGPHTEITFVHTNLPDGMGQGFTEGWMKFYILPMKAYFETAPGAKEPGKAAPRRVAKAAPKKVTAKKAAPEKVTAKKAAPKKAASKKRAPKKAAPKKAASKKRAPKKGARKPASKKPASKKRARSKKVASR